MRLSGRRLTVVLTTLFVVVLIAGATAAWSLGRHRIEAVPASAVGYQSGPTRDQTVALATEAQGHPRAAEVQVLLQHYFDSINNRDYDAWMGAVARDQSAPQTEENWTRDYATTVDSNLTVMTVADEPLRARLMFTSEQAAQSAPASLPVTCINWDVTYLLSEQDGRLVLSGIDPSAQSMTACA